MTRARMPGRHFVPGRYNERNVAVPDPVVKRLPRCKPLPRMEQRPTIERRIACWCLLLSKIFFAAGCLALLIAARH